MAVDLKQLKQDGASPGQGVVWNGTIWAPGAVGGTLDAAYDFGGSGAGRVITADAGAVHIDKGVNDANNALEVAVTSGSGAGLRVDMSGGATGTAVAGVTSTASAIGIVGNNTSGAPGYAAAFFSNFHTQGGARGNIAITDQTTLATGTGPGIEFTAKYNSGGATGHFGSLEWAHENGADNDIRTRFIISTAAGGIVDPTKVFAVTKDGYTQIASGAVYGWSSGSVTASSVTDTAFSRTTAATVAIGNGTAGNASGTMVLSTLEATSAVYAGGLPTSNLYTLVGGADIDLVQYAASAPIGNGTIIRGLFRRGTHSSPANAASGDYLLDLMAVGTTNGNYSAIMSFVATAAAGANSIPTDIVMYQVATGAVVTATETFRFSHVGTLSGTSSATGNGAGLSITAASVSGGSVARFTGAASQFVDIGLTYASAGGVLGFSRPTDNALSSVIGNAAAGSGLQASVCDLEMFGTGIRISSDGNGNNSGGIAFIISPAAILGASRNTTALKWLIKDTTSYPLQGQSGSVLGWTASTDASAALDTGLSRVAAATVAIGNGTAASAVGTLRVTTVQAPAATILNLGGGAASQVTIDTTGQTSITATVDVALGVSTTTGRTAVMQGPGLAASGGSTGFTDFLVLDDLTAVAAGVGAGITFRGLVSGSTTFGAFAQIRAKKTNSTVNDRTASLVVTLNTGTSTNNTGVDRWAFTSTGVLNGVSGAVLGLSSSSSDPTVAADTGFSRTAAATIAIGNGTAGNVSGTLNATTLSGSSGVYGGTNTPATSNSYALLQAADLDLITYAASLPIGTSTIRGISRRGTHASPTDATTTDHLLDIQAHGTTNGNPSAFISFIASAASGANSIPTDIAILQVATGSVITALETFRFKNIGTLASTSTGVFGWCAAADLTTSADTGLSRLGAASLAVGNGTAADVSGSIQASKFAVATSVFWTSGTGSPNGVVTANPGSLYSDKNGGAGVTLYVKESGTGTNTGWVAK